jgi:hypothetical protein
MDFLQRDGRSFAPGMGQQLGIGVGFLPAI